MNVNNNYSDVEGITIFPDGKPGSPMATQDVARIILKSSKRLVMSSTSFLKVAFESGDDVKRAANDLSNRIKDSARILSGKMLSKDESSELSEVISSALKEMKNVEDIVKGMNPNLSRELSGFSGELNQILTPSKKDASEGVSGPSI